jgi:iron complex transport system substrate-binding protein
MTRSLLFLVSLCLLLPGCSRNNTRTPSFQDKSMQVVKPVRYAKGFNIRSNRKNVLITVVNPWQNAKNVEYSWLLSDTLQKSRILDENHYLIKTPVSRVVCLSTTHIGFISCLNETGSIVGVSGKNFVANENLQDKIRQDQLPDVGYDENLNFELILKLKPDLVFAYGVSGSITNTVRKLNEMGIPTILIAEYLEEEPMAKMEWVKVFGALYDRSRIADEKFDTADRKYQHLRYIAAGAKNKPAVLLGLPWRGNWFISGGRSYVARLIEDAGGEYIFKQLDFKDSRPVALEQVYERALGADFWLNTGDALGKKDLFSVDDRFRNLPCIKRDQIFNNNNRITSAGGNDIFESGVAEPEIILSDLIYILHPQLLPSHQLKYYRKLQ